MSQRSVFIALVALTLALARPVEAQVLYGSIVGTVVDTTSAAVPDAEVTITQTETNQSRHAATNQSGGYTFSDVPAGSYVVVVSKNGFQSFTAKDVEVVLNGVARVNASLRVGSVSENVVVTADAAVLQTDRADVRAEVNSQSLQDLPVASRSFQTLLGTVPGATQPTYFQTGGENNSSRAMSLTINGTPATDLVVRIDGVSATNQWIPQLQAYTPTIESIETVDTVTSSFDAEQGNAGGSSVNVQVKNGTNQLHGSAFEYLENRALAARNFFLPAAFGKPKGDWNVFGGTVGGPIRKNKLFYFASFEGTLERATGGSYSTTGAVGGLVYSTVPNAATRGGDFSQTGVTIYDPTTGNSDGSGRTAFPGGIIPPSRLDPITTQKLLPLVPLPNLAGSSNNYFSIPNFAATYYRVDSKVTWAATPKLNVNGRIGYLNNSEEAAGNYPLPSGSTVNPASANINDTGNVFTSTIAANYTVTPNLLVDGLYGLTWSHTLHTKGDNGACYGAPLGIPGSCQGRDPGQPGMNITGYTVVGNNANLAEYLDPQYQFVTNAAWINGKHNVRFGLDVHRLDLNHYEVNSAPSTMTFTGGLTALKGGASPNQYNALADFLLGTPQSLFVGIDNPPLDSAYAQRPITSRTWQFGLYIRDQWQVARKLTVSYGTRWEYYPVSTRADRGIELFNFTSLKEEICGVGGNPGDCGIHVSPKQFAPRIGIAYRPTEKIVVRAGFSLNWEQDDMYHAGVYGFPALISVTQAGLNTYSSVGKLDAGVPVLSPLNISSGNISVPAGSGITTLGQNYVRGYIMSWNLTVQRSFAHNWTAQAGYVGNRAIHQDQPQNINYGLPGGGVASQPFYATLATTAAVSVIEPIAHTYYDSLQSSLTHRFSGGLSVNMNYTWSKALTNFAGGIPIPQYFHLDKGLQSTDQPQRTNIGTTWEVPFGKGKRFLSQSRVASAALGGWQVNGLLEAYSGQPFTVSASSASLNSPGSSQQANQVLPNVAILGGVGTGQPYFNPNAFAPVTCVCFGNSGFNNLRGPFNTNLDFSLFRRFALTERIGLQFRAEVFNLTNTPHFANPSGLNVSSATFGANGTITNLNGFGVITATESGERDFDQRYLRLGLRLGW